MLLAVATVANGVSVYALEHAARVWDFVTNWASKSLADLSNIDLGEFWVGRRRHRVLEINVVVATNSEHLSVVTVKVFNFLLCKLNGA